MATSTEERKLQDLLQDFDTAMLVTRTPTGKLRSRPMALADVEPDGTLWFLTQRGSGKMEEIAGDMHVNVAMQSKSKFVSVTGNVSPVDDPAKVEQLWSEAWKVWFPGGKDDPNLLLLRVRGELGEYWDNSGTSGIKYLIEAGKAYLSGTLPDVDNDPKIHGTVRMAESTRPSRQAR
jgi:general stress protein 26